MLILFALFLLFVCLRSEVTSLAFLFSALVFSTYVLPYFTLWDTFKQLNLVSGLHSSNFFLYIFLCFAGFFLGDFICNSNFKAPKRFELIVNDKKFEKYSIYVGIIGVLGYGYFIVHSGAGYFAGHQSGDYSVGGYIYELRFFVFSSVLLLFNAYLKKTLSKTGRLFLIGITAFLAFDAYIQSQRGSWIRFGVIYILSYLMFQNIPGKLRFNNLFAKYKAIVLSGIFIVVLLTFTVQSRIFSDPSYSFFDRVSLTFNVIVEKPDLIFGGSGINEGNEFVVAYNAFQANQIAGTYDFGYKWLYPFINFIPRNLWAGKPTWFTFSTDLFAITNRYGSIKVPPGAAETGFIDAFYRFFWAAPLFFALFGYYTAKMHLKSKYDVRTRFFYICFYIGSFYFLTQNIAPLIIYCLYLYIPISVVIKYSIKEKKYSKIKLS